MRWTFLLCASGILVGSCGGQVDAAQSHETAALEVSPLPVGSSHANSAAAELHWPRSNFWIVGEGDKRACHSAETQSDIDHYFDATQEEGKPRAYWDLLTDPSPALAAGHVFVPDDTLARSLLMTMGSCQTPLHYEGIEQTPDGSIIRLDRGSLFPTKSSCDQALRAGVPPFDFGSCGQLEEHLTSPVENDPRFSALLRDGQTFYWLRDESQRNARTFVCQAWSVSSKPSSEGLRGEIHRSTRDTTACKTEKVEQRGKFSYSEPVFSFKGIRETRTLVEDRCPNDGVGEGITSCWMSTHYVRRRSADDPGVLVGPYRWFYDQRDCQYEANALHAIQEQNPADPRLAARSHCN